MKQPIKLCTGFDKPICRHCKRKDSSGTRLVESLSIEEFTGFNKCQYYLI